MGARRKLNEIHLAGSVALAAAIGLASGSWSVFAIVGVVLISASLVNGNVRPDRHRRR
jgi:hypothetical protein